MFFLRGVKDKNQTQDDEDLSDVVVETGSVSANATVSGKSYQMLSQVEGKESEAPKLAQALGKNKKSEEDEVSGTLELGASLDFRGKNPKHVSSAIQTGSFFFEQLLRDMQDHQFTENVDMEGTITAMRQDLMNEFHANMLDVLNNYQQIAMTSPDRHRDLAADTRSIEDILAHGADTYLADIQKMMKKGFEDNVNVWYRGLTYDAYIKSHGTDTQIATIGTRLYDLTFGACGNLCRAIMPKARVDDEGGDYVALGNERHGYRTKHVLKDISGVVRHSRLTLVIGPPGCGKTSYLKAIAGHLHKQRGVDARLSGEVRYNSFLVDKLKNLANWSAFVAQTDEHLALLSVRETLEFAWQCRKKARHESPEVFDALVERYGLEAANRISALSAVEIEFVMAVLGLANCADTIIGNETLKGVSGGERRRVTLGEMLVTGAQVCCLDEISTGLDSAATYDITRYLQGCAHFLKQAIVVSLLQPPPEVVMLFDDVVLLGEGNVVYHGPLSECLPYFERIGFRCPPKKDIGDFLQELPTDSGQKFLMSREEWEKVPGAHLSIKRPKNADEMGAVWKQVAEGQAMARSVEEEAQTQFQRAEEVERNSSSLQSKIKSWDDFPVNSAFAEMRVVLRWAMNYKLKNRPANIAKLISTTFMGLLYGTLFWQVPNDQWYLKAMLFQTVPGIMQQTAIPGMQDLIKDRNIFYKQHAASFYKAPTFAAAVFWVNFPYTLLDSLIFAQFVYWMCGLVPSVSQWGVYVLIGILHALAMNQMMRIFAYIGRDQDQAMVYAVLSILLCSVYNGSIATYHVIPHYLVWIYWINPLAWSVRALAINEFRAGADYDRTPCPIIPGSNDCGPNALLPCAPMRCGDFYLEARQFQTDIFFMYGAIALLCVYITFFFTATAVALSRVRFGKIYSEELSTEEVESTEAANAAMMNESYSQHQQETAVVPVERTDSFAVEMKVLVFSDLWYTVHIPRTKTEEAKDIDLLKGVCGWAEPGKMTALMGSSGAGKTTLMDVLAGRKTTGTIRGHILVNSVPVNMNTFKQVVGYVEQFGVHDNYSTVHESLLFSAGLRLECNSEERISRFVDEIMDLLELHKIAQSTCGSLSVEENKKLTIAVEMVSNPSVLFADEPTSGLDARGASIVMRGIRNVARSGRTVICTIHQPSRAVFQMFDVLLLMRRGGKVVYFGEIGHECSTLVKYFEEIPGTNPCPDEYNPATWMLEVIGAGVGKADKNSLDYATVYSKSNLWSENRKRLKYEFLAPERAEDPLPGDAYLATSNRHLMASGSVSVRNLLASPMQRKLLHQKQQLDLMQGQRTFGIKPKKSFLTQVSYMLGRARQGYWRAPEFSLNRLMVITFVACLNTLTFFQQEYTTSAELQSRIIVMMFMALLSGLYNLFTIMPFQIAKRALYFRETSSGMYSILAAVIADGIVETPYLIVETLIGVNIMYWGIGFYNDLFTWAYYSVVFYLYLLLMTFLGMLFANLMPDATTAQLAAIFMILIIQNFSGVIVPYNKLPTVYKPMYYFSPQTYVLEGLYTTQFHDDYTYLCNPTGLPLASTDNCNKVRDEICARIPASQQHKFSCDLDGSAYCDSLKHTCNKATGNFSQWCHAQLPPKNQDICDKLPKMCLLVDACTTDGVLPENLNEFKEIQKKVTGIHVTAKEFVLDQFLSGFKYRHRFMDVGVLIGWIICLRIATVVVALNVNHNKR